MYLIVLAFPRHRWKIDVSTPSPHAFVGLAYRGLLERDGCAWKDGGVDVGQSLRCRRSLRKTIDGEKGCGGDQTEEMGIVVRHDDSDSD